MERYLFFNSTEGDRRLYQAADMADYWTSFLVSGLFVNDGGTPGLQPTTDGLSRVVSISSGRAEIGGHLYINDGIVNLSIDGADATLSRIDRIVLRLDNRIESRYIKLFVVKGIPSDNPMPPELNRQDNVYELSIAQVNVGAGKAFVDNGDITDEGLDRDLCGLVKTKYLSESVLDANVIINENNKLIHSTNLEDAIQELHGPLTVMKSDQDELGIYTKVEWKNGETLVRVSMLSNPDADGNYLTRVNTLYNPDGSIRDVQAFTRTFDVEGNITSEVPQL